jgi:hypothetical protein
MQYGYGAYKIRLSDHIHIASFSSKLMNWRNKVNTEGWKFLSFEES